MSDAAEIYPRLSAPDAEGFRRWVIPPASAGVFLDIYSGMRARVESDGKVRCRIDTGRAHSNIQGGIHGGYITAFIDETFFVAAQSLGLYMDGGVSVSLSAQFMASGRVGEPLDAVCELMRETGRMLFMRGTVEQDGVLATFEGVLRKNPRPPQ